MSTKLIVSLVEIIFLVYTFHIMKTTIDFNILKSPDHFLFKHAIGDDKTKRVCLFGQIMIVPLIIILLVRNFVAIPQEVPFILTILGLGLSVANINAFIYLIPICIAEYCLLTD